MKLKKIAQLCDKRKIYILYDKPAGNGDTQWLSDGCAAYPLDGIPPLDEESLCRMFDISGKRRDNLVIKRQEIHEKLCLLDTDPDEAPVQEMELGISYQGRDLLPIITREGIVFIQGKYLSPFDGEKDLIELYERKTCGQTYIAVKTGLLIRGVIMPVNVADDRFVNQLRDLLQKCRREAERNRIQQDEGGASQLSWTEIDSEDGV